MEKFIDHIQSKNFVAGEKLEAGTLIVAQKILVKMGLNFIPESYIDFLKHYNGIKANGAYLYGATVDNDLDIVDQNSLLRKPQNVILLGHNDFDFLAYNYLLNCYQIIDRNDLAVLDTYEETELDLALAEIFNV